MLINLRNIADQYEKNTEQYEKNTEQYEKKY
jgi:hypothetical protein